MCPRQNEDVYFLHNYAIFCIETWINICYY